MRVSVCDEFNSAFRSMVTPEVWGKIKGAYARSPEHKVRWRWYQKKGDYP